MPKPSTRPCPRASLGSRSWAPGGGPKFYRVFRMCRARFQCARGPQSPRVLRIGGSSVPGMFLWPPNTPGLGISNEPGVLPMCSATFPACWAYPVRCSQCARRWVQCAGNVSYFFRGLSNSVVILAIQMTRCVPIYSGMFTCAGDVFGDTSNVPGVFLTCSGARVPGCMLGCFQSVGCVSIVFCNVPIAPGKFAESVRGRFESVCVVSNVLRDV